MSLPLALVPGTIIGNNYVIESLINIGGFGAIYRATDISEGNRPCALKETYDVTPAARRQALMEASVLFTVRNEHLPQVYDALEADGRFYLVMQLIEGQDLLQLLKSRAISRHMASVGEQEPYQTTQGPCTEQEVLAWLLPIMNVLQELHSRAIVHRDIKPANIILTPNQTTVLVDFGLTKLYDARSSNTQTLVRAVSEGFSPLEQYTGRTGPQSDIYAMAATIYLLLTNCLPPPAIKRRIHDELIAPHQLNPTISSKAESALLKALTVQADQRYQTMSEFAQALCELSFNAYADVTLVGRQSSPTMLIHPQPQQSLVLQKQPLPVPASTGVPQPHPLNKGVPPVVHPVAPMAYGVVPQAAVVVSAHLLPTPFGQGCLFGLIQAVLAALLVLFLKKEPLFYLGTFMGFFFYALAGFMTTHKGGSSIRGSWSGLWAGITSTVMFWIVLFIGLFILLAQRVEIDTTKAQRLGKTLPPNELKHAWSAIQPAYPNYSFAPAQSPLVNLLFLLGGGMLLASTIGWLGGKFGTSKYQEKIAKKQHRVP